MPLKFVTVNDNVFQLLGDFVPQTPTGAPPLDPAGSPRSPRLCSSKISLKNPLGSPSSNSKCANHYITVQCRQ